MDKILQRLYENMMQEIGEDEMSLMLKRGILDLLESDGPYLDRAGYEKCRDLAFRAAEVGEEAGFYRGFRYAMRLFMECGL